MKYLITESQLDKAMVRFLDIQGLKKVKRKSIIFFTTNPDSGTSDIAYYGNQGRLYITAELCSDIMSMFSLEGLYDCLLVVKQWVQNEVHIPIKIENVHVYAKESMFGDITFKIPEE